MIRIKLEKLLSSNFFKKGLSVFFFNWGSFLIELIIGVIVVRFYGSEGKGEFSGLIAVIGVLAAFLSMGLNLSRVFFVNKKKVSENKLFSIQIYYQFFLNLILIPLYFFFKIKISSFLELNSDYLSILFIFILLYLNTQIILLFLNTGFLGSGKIKEYGILKISLVVIKLSSILSCIYLELHVLYSLIPISILEVIFILFCFKREKLILKSFSYIKMVNILDFFKFGIKSNLTVVFNNLIRRFDYFLIVSMLGVSVLGKYTVALIFYNLLLSIPQAINGILFGELTNREVTKKKILEIVKSIFIIALIVGIILMFFTKFIIISLFGENFSDIIPIAMMLIIAGVIQGSSGVFKVSLISRDKAQWNSYEQILTGLIQIVTMLVLINKYELIGVSIALITGSICSFSLRYYFYEKN